MPQWKWHGRVLFFTGEHGADVTPTADQVYRVTVERKVVTGLPSPDSPVALRFSRYPLIPALTLDLDDQGTPVLGLTGRCRGRNEVLSMADLQRGHVVLSGTWFPIDVEASSDIWNLLFETRWSLGACPLREFFRIRKTAAEDGLVEDLIGRRSISPMAFTPSSDDVPRVNAQLYPYQLAGWRWLRFIRSAGLGGLLADEMGLGKSLQVISAIRDPGIEESGPCLIVAPGSILENWRREIARFAPTLSTLKHHGPHRTGRPADLKGYDVVITSYDNVVRDNSLLNMIEWDVVVLDEAQFIRNPDAQRTKATKHLNRRIGLAVTGTPVENRLLDLWSIIDFVMPDQLGNRKSFEARFPDDEDGARLLESEVSPLMLRRRISEVAQDLPNRIDIPQIVELTESEAADYDDTRERIAKEYGAAATLVALIELRRFCAHPQLLKNEAGDPTEFGKFQRLDEILREIFLQGEKALVFTSFTAMADMIAQYVRGCLHTFSDVIDGRVPIDDRQPLIDRFSAVRGPAALVLNPRAGGTGLNITAANHVIHYNPEWNPALEDQASARAHRRGQELPVTIHRLVVADTVEDVISDRLERKRAIAETAVVGLAGQDADYADIIRALSLSPATRLRS